jgi:hypothetical protein
MKSFGLVDFTHRVVRACNRQVESGSHTAGAAGQDEPPTLARSAKKTPHPPLRNIGIKAADAEAGLKRAL